jgi:hypothetical protein
MKVIISQPRYLPAINYIQRLYFTDLFIFLDNIQRQARGWENRNKILVKEKEIWLTIPISSSSRELIKNTKIEGKDWVKSHKDKIYNAYSKHPYFDRRIIDAYYNNVEEVIESSRYDFSTVVIYLIQNMCKIFNFYPNVAKASDYCIPDDIKGPLKLVEICKRAHASIYISGVNGREYGVKEAFKDSEIRVLFHNYNYPIYKQYQQNSFIPWLSFFDPLFNLGVDKVNKMIKEMPNLLEN